MHGLSSEAARVGRGPCPDNSHGFAEFALFVTASRKAPQLRLRSQHRAWREREALPCVNPRIFGAPAWRSVQRPAASPPRTTTALPRVSPVRRVARQWRAEVAVT